MGGAYYSFWRVLEGRKELDKKNRLPKNQAEYLLRDNNMRGLYLGGALDSCRWGSPVTVMWEMNTKEMIAFIQTWMKQNEKFGKGIQSGLHERKLKEIYKKFELPHLDQKCPIKEHEKKLEFKGITYCGEYSTKELNLTEILISEDPYIELKLKDFFDKNHTLANLLIKTYEESVSYHCNIKCEEDCEIDHGYEIIECKEMFNWLTRREILGDYSLEFELKFNEDLGPSLEHVYNEEIEKLKQEIPTTRIIPCRGILSDKGKILSLETILNRLNINPEFETVYCPNRLYDCDVNKEADGCNGHKKETHERTFTCDGWDIAFYVQRWMKQVPKGEAPIFESGEERLISNAYPKYIPQFVD